MLVKKLFVPIMGICISLLVAGTHDSHAETATQKVTKYADSVLAQLAVDPTIVSAVRAENAKNKTLDEIRKRDEEWIAAQGITPFMREKMESPMGRHLAAIRDTQKFFKEIFLQDNQGAIIALSDKSSDYWQGDEDKFQRPYKRNATFVDNVKFDASTKSFLAHVNVPVRDKDTVIGVITFGIDMDIFWMTPM